MNHRTSSSKQVKRRRENKSEASVGYNNQEDGGRKAVISESGSPPSRPPPSPFYYWAVLIPTRILYRTTGIIIGTKKHDDHHLKKKQTRDASIVLGGICLVVVVVVVLLVSALVHKTIGEIKGHRNWIMNPISLIERRCPPPSYETLATTSKDINKKNNNKKKEKICLTTLTDTKTKTIFHSTIRRRNFDDILSLTWDNKASYAKKHGYTLIDGSHLVDYSRPPAWSKILAVQDLITTKNKNKNRNNDDDDDDDDDTRKNTIKPQCDWVMWLDADTLFMNSSIRIEQFLPTDTTKHFIVAIDAPLSGYNSGSFLVRNSDWSRKFLQQWWNMTDFVKLPGFSMSGDNAAMKHLLEELKQNNGQEEASSEFQKHVLVPPRCTLNSFAKFLLTPMSSDDELKQQDYYMSENYYHKGDLLVHLAGYDNKAGTIQLMLEQAT